MKGFLRELLDALTLAALYLVSTPAEWALHKKRVREMEQDKKVLALLLTRRPLIITKGEAELWEEILGRMNLTLGDLYDVGRSEQKRR